MDVAKIRDRVAFHARRLRQEPGDTLVDVTENLYAGPPSDLPSTRELSEKTLRILANSHSGKKRSESRGAPPPAPTSTPAAQHPSRDPLLARATRDALLPLVRHFLREQQQQHAADVQVVDAPANAKKGRRAPLPLLRACLSDDPHVDSSSPSVSLPVASGNFSEVYKVPAADRTRRKHLAVKVLRFSDNPWMSLEEQIWDWRREARVLREAANLGVAPAVHSLRLCRRPDSVYAITVMDFLRGVSLAEWNETASPEEVVRANRVAVEKLQKLHTHGITHGDLHAGNVLVIPKGTTKKTSRIVLDVFILDYGFAKFVQASKLQDVLELYTLTDGRLPRDPPMAEHIADALMADGTVQRSRGDEIYKEDVLANTGLPTTHMM